MERRNVVTVLTLCLLATTCRSDNRYKIPIGVIIGPEDSDGLTAVKHAFWEHSNSSLTSVLEPVVERFEWLDVLQVGQAVCNLLSRGVYSLLYPSNSFVHNVLTAYSNAFQVPMVSSAFPESAYRKDASFGVTIRVNTIPAVAEVLKLYKWRSFIYLYDSEEGPEKLQQLLKSVPNTRLVPGGLQRVTSGEEATMHLRKLQSDSPDSIKRVILATRPHLARDIIATHVHDSSLRQKEFHFLLTDPVTEESMTNDAAVTGTIYIYRFRIADPNSLIFRRFTTAWKTLMPKRWHGDTESIPRERAILMYDGAKLLNHAYDRLLQDHPGTLRKYAGKTGHVNGTPTFNCMTDEPGKWELGSLIAQYIRESRVPDGLTGNIQFDSKGDRRGFTFDLMQTSPTAHVQIGSWSDVSGMKIIREPTTLPLGDIDVLKKKTLKITSILDTPFLMQNGQGNYKGYIVDLADKLAELLGFEYHIQLVKDNRYGKLDSKNEWTGMIGEVMRDEADLALAPLTITTKREESIDFTRPFMSVSATIIMKKPDPSKTRKTTQGLFFFLSAFSYDVWISLTVAYVVFSILGYVVSRFTGQPDRIRSLETKHSDRLSVFSSFWFSLGSSLMRSTGVYPRSLSHRLLTIIWWLFTLVVVVVYMASLTSLLVVDKTLGSGSAPSYLRDVNKVMEHSLKTGSPQIGAISGGSSEAFFKGSSHALYKRYGAYITKNPTTTTNSYNEGITRVKERDNYAFIMESLSADYTTRRECNLMMVPGSFYTTGYGIVVKQGSPLRETLSTGLLQLEESGILTLLYNKWWKEDSVCSESSGDSFVDLYAGHLTLTDMMGVFTVLIIGIILGLIVAIAEYFLRSRHMTLLKEKGQPKSGAI